MDYSTPILSDEHAAFCKEEAKRRYDGQLITDTVGMIVILDCDNGLTHTDDVLRALSFYKRRPEFHALKPLPFPMPGENDLDQAVAVLIIRGATDEEIHALVTDAIKRLRGTD